MAEVNENLPARMEFRPMATSVAPYFPFQPRNPFIRLFLAFLIAVVLLLTCGCHGAAGDFEAEADPSRMTLGMHTWTWIETAYNNDTVARPVEKEAFTVTFVDGRVKATTDCNGFGGAYTVDGHKIQFDDKMAMTRMYCEGSQETEFVKMLLAVRSYFFTDEGELIFEIKFDSGVMRFR
jgi:heat shock protein HslJ